MRPIIYRNKKRGAIMANKPAARRMSKKEQEEFDKLYEYVRTNILGYDTNQSLSKNIVLRLKGMRYNKFMENRSIKDTADYSFELILNTFKYCYLDIQKALRTVNFVDEGHKFNYIMRIVEDKLNEVYMRTKNAEKAEEKTKSVDMSVMEHQGAEYQSSRKNVSNRLKDLW